MKKFSFLSLALICSIFMGMSLSSCGDDEPIITNDIQKSELTTPLFLFEKPSTSVADILTNGFTFWAFTENKAAECAFVFVNTKLHLRCDRYEENWSLGNGTINLGGTGSIITRITALNVKAYMFFNKTYFASNMTVAGVKAEDILPKGYTREQLWQAIDNSKATGQLVPISQ